MNKKRLFPSLCMSALTAAVILSATPIPALADVTDASDLTPVVNEETTSNVVQAGVVTTEVGLIEAGQGQAIAVTDSGATAATGIASAAVGTVSDGTSSTTASPLSTADTAVSTADPSQSTAASSSSGVVVAGSSTASGPSSNSSDASRGNVVVAGAGGSGVISTVGEQNLIVPTMLGGATLIMFNSVSDGQILSCMIQTNDGSLIIVDGGYGEDAAYLTNQIVARGGHVAAWLITHPHADHAGALYTILQDQDAAYAAGIEPQVTIDGIYYSFGDAGWYQTFDPDESTIALALLGELAGRPDTMLHSVHQGETFQVDTATVQVLNNRYQGSSDYGNNASIVYKVTVNGVSILFLGDLPAEGGNYLLQTLSPSVLKSDIVQMAHHGQNGVSEEFYKAVSPRVCLWPTPAWLWASQESKYTIQQTKQWMADLGVLYHYCMKDGDQIIR